MNFGSSQIITDENEDNFLLVCPQLVEPDKKGLAVMVGYKSKKMLDFYAMNDGRQELLCSAQKNNENSWIIKDERNKVDVSDMDKVLEKIENSKVLGEDGILYSETIKTMIDDIKNVYKNNNKLSK